MRKTITILLLVLTLSIFAGCVSTVVKENTQVNNPVITTAKIDPKLETTQELKKFSSIAELKQYLDENSNQNVNTVYSVAMRGSLAVDNMVMEEAVPTAAPMAKAADSGSGQADDYSQTNVQVQGVDEADFVKNDNKYIYTLSQDKLVIVDAYPAEDAKILSKTEIDGTPQNLFVNDDRLVIFTNTDDETYMIPEFDYVPRQRYTQNTHALVYDISDRSNPKLVEDYSVNGYYYDARMIGDYVYFISKESVYYYNNIIDIPVIRASGATLLTPEIYYFDNPESNFVFHTISAFNIKTEEYNAKTFMMGYSNTLMVSKDNIYIAYQKNLPWRYYEYSNEDRFYKVIVPLLSKSTQDEIGNIKDSNLNSYEKWEKISSILEDMYNNMDEKDKDSLVKEIDDAIQEYEVKQELERSKTIVQKIAIDKENIDYVGKAEVQGQLLNQFSMDEFEGNLRLATTTNIWTTKGAQMYNNVYVLDKNMKTIGTLEKIAPDESIYSTRFIGDRLYMVTFKRIDPLFVIDLSNPKNPSVLGELKIPGYSDYLHPYDETHIIGIGKETADNQWGGTSIKGLKLALFDVSDVSNPKVVDQYEIGTSGTDSEALREHKAFLFDKEKNLLVIPVREVEGSKYRDPRYGYLTQKVWQGAYVFSLTEDGFELKGKVSHYEDDEDYRYYWGSPYAVRRSLFMDDVLYTVSAKKILANSLDNIDDEISEVDLPYKEDRYYPVYY